MQLVKVYYSPEQYQSHIDLHLLKDNFNVIQALPPKHVVSKDGYSFIRILDTHLEVDELGDITGFFKLVPIVVEYQTPNIPAAPYAGS